MTNLHDILQTHVSTDRVPGAWAWCSPATQVEVQAAGSASARRQFPRWPGINLPRRSITKPITAAAVI